MWNTFHSQSCILVNGPNDKTKCVSHLDDLDLNHLHSAFSSHENVVRGNALMCFHLSESDARLFHPVVESASDIILLVIV